MPRLSASVSGNKSYLKTSNDLDISLVLYYISSIFSPRLSTNINSNTITSSSFDLKIKFNSNIGESRHVAVIQDGSSLLEAAT